MLIAHGVANPEQINHAFWTFIFCDKYRHDRHIWQGRHSSLPDKIFIYYSITIFFYDGSQYRLKFALPALTASFALFHAHIYMCKDANAKAHTNTHTHTHTQQQQQQQHAMHANASLNLSTLQAQQAQQAQQPTPMLGGARSQPPPAHTNLVEPARVRGNDCALKRNMIYMSALGILRALIKNRLQRNFCWMSCSLVLGLNTCRRGNLRLAFIKLLIRICMLHSNQQIACHATSMFFHPGTARGQWQSSKGGNWKWAWIPVCGCILARQLLAHVLNLLWRESHYFASCFQLQKRFYCTRFSGV